MKKVLFLLVFTTFSLISQAITVVSSPGGLSAAITTAGATVSTVTNLTVSGSMDARDFKLMRDSMPVLGILDLSDANIVAYSGHGGTEGTSSYDYPANEIPTEAFFFGTPLYSGKASLTSVVLPNTLTSIGTSAFDRCANLVSVTIPASVTNIQFGAFYQCVGLKTLTLPASLITIGHLAFQGCINWEGTLDLSESITSIGESAFMRCRSLTGSLTIPSKISTIETNAFQECVGLTGALNIPSTITVIKSGAFQGSTGFSSLTLPSSLTSIGTYAFRECSGLDGTVVIPNGITTLNDGLFWGCTGIDSVSIPSTVTLIDGYTFANCTGLHTFDIPYNTTYLGDCCFIGCTNIDTLFISDKVTYIGDVPFSSSNIVVNWNNMNFSSQDGVLFDKNKTRLIECPDAKAGKYVVPSTVNTIGLYAFYESKNLNSIVIPPSVTMIEEQAFKDCTGLNSIYVTQSTPIDLTGSPEAFSAVNKNTCSLFVPVGSKSLYTSTYQWQDFTHIVDSALVLHADTVVIKTNALSDSIQLSAQVAWTAISNQPWLNIAPNYGTSSKTLTLVASTLSSVLREATVTILAPGYDTLHFVVRQEASEVPFELTVSVGALDTALNYAGYYGVDKIKLKGTLDATDFKVLRDSMPNLKELDISEVSILAYTGIGGTVDGNIEYFADEIPARAFHIEDTLGKKIRTIVFPVNLKSIGDYAFYYCDSLDNIVFPNTLETIGENAFEECHAIRNLDFPASLKWIKKGAFYGLESISSLIIPPTIERLDAWNFARCIALTNVEMQAPLDSLQQGMFAQSVALHSITLPPTIKYFGEMVFSVCPSLPFFELPDSLQYVDASCFYGCDGFVGEIVLPNTIKVINNEAFYACNNLVSVQLPDSLKVLDELFLYCDNLRSVRVPAGVNYMKRFIYSCPYFNRLEIENPVPLVGLSQIDANAFSSIDKGKCVLIVPKGSLQAYKTAPLWNEFTYIVEEDSVLSKVITVAAGQLSSYFTAVEKVTVTHLTLSGTIDVRDIYFMRDSLPSLMVLDLQNVSIDGYTGILDTVIYRSASVETYAANTLPVNAFSNKTSLTKIILPASLSAIQDSAFSGCIHLDSLVMNNPVPVDLSATTGVFDAVTIDSCVLVVPAGSYSIYRSATVWQDFFTITTTNLQPVHASPKHTVFVDNGKVVITGALNQTIAIYNLQGMCLYKEQANSDLVSVSLPAHGVYLVRIGDWCEKVVY